MKKSELSLSGIGKNKALAVFLSSAAFAAAGCDSKTKGTETSPNNKPVATQTQESTTTTEAKSPLPQETSNADLVARFKNKEMGAWDKPLDCRIFKEGDVYMFRVTNTSDMDAGHFVVRIMGQSGLHGAIPPKEIDTKGLEIDHSSESPSSDVDVPGLGVGDSIMIDAEFPEVIAVEEQVLPRFPGWDSDSITFSKLESGRAYQPGVGELAWDPKTDKTHKVS